MTTTTTTTSIMFWRCKVYKFGTQTSIFTYKGRIPQATERKGGMGRDGTGLGTGTGYGKERGQMKGVKREWETYTGLRDGRSQLDG